MKIDQSLRDRSVRGEVPIGGKPEIEFSMSDLDKVAVAAMQGVIVSRVTFPDESVAGVAALAYNMADAMAAEKVKRAVEAAQAKADEAEAAKQAKADEAKEKADHKAGHAAGHRAA